ncbi:MAG: L-2-hydroxyglutarate oxidase [Saprospiraceae bacterium]|nr:L-2-hydroxyglutarate oxidase [Saprospiraceae bacterium]
MSYNITIIGAGIVGLATAYKASLKFPDSNIIILEKESKIAAHQTGNNSGVIHSGIYYQPGSLKALNCINGYRQLLDFCDSHNIKYEICGKLIVATKEEELIQLDKLYSRGIENGLSGLRFLSPDEIKEIEPFVEGIKGIFVPQTGVIDYLEVSAKLLEQVINKNGRIFFNEKVISVKNGKKIEVRTESNTYTADFLINCAGLYSDKITKMTMDIPYRIIPFRGEYYKLKKEKYNLVKNLIYPVPNPQFPFLGVHFTRMIKGGGGVEAGPNAVLAYAREGYTKTRINLKELFEVLLYKGFFRVAWKFWSYGLYEMYRSYSKTAFTKALQRLIPSVRKSDLVAGGAGIRAQVCKNDGTLVDDFLIFEKENIINVVNAPSPAATASLAIADEITDRIKL